MSGTGLACSLVCSLVCSSVCSLACSLAGSRLAPAGSFEYAGLSGPGASVRPPRPGAIRPANVCCGGLFARPARQARWLGEPPGRPLASRAQPGQQFRRRSQASKSGANGHCCRRRATNLAPGRRPTGERQMEERGAGPDWPLYLIIAHFYYCAPATRRPTCVTAARPQVGALRAHFGVVTSGRALIRWWWPSHQAGTIIRRQYWRQPKARRRAEKVAKWTSARRLIGRAKIKTNTGVGQMSSRRAGGPIRRAGRSVMAPAGRPKGKHTHTHPAERPAASGPPPPGSRPGLRHTG